MEIMIGIAGGTLILIAWLLEILIETRKRGGAIDMRFSVIYFAGNYLLLLYSWLAGVWVFFWLNLAILALVIFEVWYSHHVRKRSRRR